MAMPWPATCMLHASGHCPNGDNCCFAHDTISGRQRKPERIKAPAVADAASLAHIVPKDAAVMRKTYRRLTEAVYRRWCPEKLQKVSAIMEKYLDQEGEVYQKAVQLYVFAQDRKHWLPLIRGMYERFNPAKLKDFDQVLEKYRGSETELFKALCQRYIPTLSREDPPLELHDWGGSAVGHGAGCDDDDSGASFSEDGQSGRPDGRHAGALMRPLSSQNSLVEAEAGRHLAGHRRPCSSSRDGERKRRRHTNRHKAVLRGPRAAPHAALLPGGSQSPSYCRHDQADPYPERRPEPRAKLVRRSSPGASKKDGREPPLLRGRADPARPPGNFNSLNDE